MADFSPEIAQFQRDGTYNYEFDESGNLYFNSASADFSHVYLSLPLTNVVYNDAKIDKFYNSAFLEFVPTVVTSSAPSVDDLTAELGVVQQENITLRSQLDDFIAQNQISSAASDSQAVQQIILALRIALGQGRIASNFSTTFPYAPLTQQSSSAA